MLRFLAELCREVEVKDWLGSVQNSQFWPPLLHLLCTMPHHLSAVHGMHSNKVNSVHSNKVNSQFWPSLLPVSYDPQWLVKELWRR